MALRKEQEMSEVKRDIAKVLCGYAGAETIGHWWMGIWGRDLLPMHIGSFTFTPALNTFAMIAWPLVLAALVYFGWWYRKVGDAVPPRATSVAT
jgi:hypothetical protein